VTSARRIVSRLACYLTSCQVFAVDDRGRRLAWTQDLLPGEPGRLIRDDMDLAPPDANGGKRAAPARDEHRDRCQERVCDYKKAARGGCLHPGRGTGFHIHTRDAPGAGSLSPDDVAAMVAARQGAEEAGSDIEVGLTTGAWMVPDLGAHLAMTGGWAGVDCATVNVSKDGFGQVMAVTLEAGVGIDVASGRWKTFAASSGRGSCRTWHGSASSSARVRRTICRVIRRRTPRRSTRPSTPSA
jgi:hypothetical protein